MCCATVKACVFLESETWLRTEHSHQASSGGCEANSPRRKPGPAASPRGARPEPTSPCQDYRIVLVKPYDDYISHRVELPGCRTRSTARLNQREGEGERQSSSSSLAKREEREPESQMLV